MVTIDTLHCKTNLACIRFKRLFNPCERISAASQTGWYQATLQTQWAIDCLTDFTGNIYFTFSITTMRIFRAHTFNTQSGCCFYLGILFLNCYFFYILLLLMKSVKYIFHTRWWSLEDITASPCSRVEIWSKIFVCSTVAMCLCSLWCSCRQESYC